MTEIRPEQPDCPRCKCCTEALCERGAATILECLGHTIDAARATVAGCPCSSEETPGTAAWRAGRLRVTQHALDEDRRLPDDQLEALRQVAALQDPVDCPEQVFALAARRYVAMVGSRPELTELGAVYLRALEEERVESAASVVAVDVKARTALVAVYAVGPEPVTVLLDQLLVTTELEAQELPGRPLVVMTNLPGTVEDVVLTGIRLLPPPPASAVPGDAAEEGRVDDALAAVPASEAPTAVIPVVAVPPGGTEPIADTAVMPLAEAPLAGVAADGAP